MVLLPAAVVLVLVLLMVSFSIIIAMEVHCTMESNTAVDVKVVEALINYLQWSTNDLKDQRMNHGLNSIPAGALVLAKTAVHATAMPISVRNSVDVTLTGVEIDSKGVNASVVLISIKGVVLGNALV
jgi:hypothetical protein